MYVVQPGHRAGADAIDGSGGCGAGSFYAATRGPLGAGIPGSRAPGPAPTTASWV